MLRSIKRRLKGVERRARQRFWFWPDDTDNFIAALGVDPADFKIANPDGSVGYDVIAALSSIASEDWADEIDTTNPTP